MKIKSKNDYDFKCKLTHKELVLIELALKNLKVSDIPPVEVLNDTLYDCDEYVKDKDVIPDIIKIHSEIVETLSKIYPY